MKDAFGCLNAWMVWNNDEILFSKKSFDVKAPYRKEDFMDSQFKLKLYYVLNI